jgi:hypothetical protein
MNDVNRTGVDCRRLVWCDALRFSHPTMSAEITHHEGHKEHKEKTAGLTDMRSALYMCGEMAIDHDPTS